MTILSEGASARGPASPPYAPAMGDPVNLVRADIRWRHGRGLLAQLLLGGFFALARRLSAWQRRLEDRDRLERLPDYLLRDIGMTRHDIDPFAGQPFSRR